MQYTQKKKGVQIISKDTKSIDMCIGLRIRLRRQVLKMTQADLGRELGVSPQQVQRYECDGHRVFAGRLHKMARILKVPISYFYEDVASKGKHSSNPIEKEGFVDLVTALSHIETENVRKKLYHFVQEMIDDAEAGT